MLTFVSKGIQHKNRETLVRPQLRYTVLVATLEEGQTCMREGAEEIH